ncbi:class I SAM-dependent RNA methyltransferase [Microbacterium sp. SORGH_AS_0888]|uniref:class I SAM-dependent RNA methyltransferase n=1 Tax=Microbacterium sp. SORGH_AS_0888 TaxID=3041791 RepID=UPI002785BEAD|nr:TRAM domain-containing protein [Microbacterium sp. SORGH_AS_0888]MDQ1131392.1 tRNA/tmRNA/rRNA uracil-C5-methylase (TrmA/RlmC/RlmD family) [Microbacterium sp. SORGH_AS_0888]
MDAGEHIDLEITGVAHGGVFVGRHEGRVVFVPDTLPGERVRVRLTETRKKSFWRGEVAEVLTASPDRRPHVWAQAGLDHPAPERPGGADFGHIELERQRSLKRDVVRDALARIGRLDVPVEIEGARPRVDANGEVTATESADGTGWRTRVSLHVDEDGRVGPYAARSHTVVPVSELPLATAAVARAAARLRGTKPGRIDLVQPADGRVRVLPRPAGAPADPLVRETVVETAGDREFRLDAGGFWQVHRLAASTLHAMVTESLAGLGGLDGDARHLDLYGGVGLFAAAIGALIGPGAKVTTVESDERATEHAGANLADWVGARAETARVERWLAQLQATASPAERARISDGVVVLDPPRSGAGIEVTRAVARLTPRAVVYVACDPVALARDLAVFAEAGYRADEVRAVDLFPHSHHIEAVTTLIPVDRRG